MHTYGFALPIGEKPTEEWQHRGYGKELMEEAESIARDEWDMKKIVVISGVGARPYFRKLGYRKNGPYMAKRLDS